MLARFTKLACRRFSGLMSFEEHQARVKLAAALQLSVKHDWNESVSNHYSFGFDDEGKWRILLNPKWHHWSKVTAGSLLKLDPSEDCTEVLESPDGPDPSAWAIHSAIHEMAPQAHCILHVHSYYATTICSLADTTIHPID
jgi:ribulose-5-phosphate 4-epimerase/fuculose-1-phosphate aldolase